MQPAMSVDNSTPRVIFAHGKESGPWGSKISHLADIARHHGYAVDSPDYQGMDDPRDRVAQLLATAAAGAPLVLVGSSMGGYVSAMACRQLRPRALMLMAPALYLDGYPGEPADCPLDTLVFHGWDDDIVPVESSLRFAQSRRAALHLLADGHRLAESLEMIGQLFARQLQRALAGD